jgi:hypothetical protein
MEVFTYGGRFANGIFYFVVYNAEDHTCHISLLAFCHKAHIALSHIPEHEVEIVYSVSNLVAAAC